ncbi:MAG: Quinohemoprotein alcohol dehydrogenase ADH IIB [Steroidobacteraceae bacterium]|nr:Quinohemoprotein alcohol dehydrogenase ADH IIB [Steroidobacteraceae bacterium]
MMYILRPCAIALCLSISFTTPSAAAGEPAPEWLLHGRDATEQRYSPLTRINRSNVARLGLAWTFDDFVVRGRTHRGVEATPLMHDGVLYFTGPWSVVYAIDARSGAQRWFYDPEVDGAWARRACCDAVNRGVALHKGTLYVGTLDGWLVALDAHSGKLKWRVDTLIDRSRDYTITGAPRIAGDHIVIGNGGAELGVRGYVSAYDAGTGRLSWRFFTIPGPGPDEHPEVALARGTWGKDARWDIGGGGTVWDSMTYDPDLGLLYVGVGNGGPWPAWVRNGGERHDNLFLSSIVALDATTGRMAWYYQTTPGDSWDYTATQNMILADLPIGGRTRKVLMQAPKNGFFYVLDRESGELLSAKPYTTVTWASHVDPASGKPAISPGALYAGSPKLVWPSPAGGHNWPPMAFSPQSSLAYIPVLEMPLRFSTDAGPTPYIPGDYNTAATVSPPDPRTDAALLGASPPFAMQSVLKAWDPAAGRVSWQSAPMPYWGGGVLATAGGLVVQGSADGVLVAYDASTGHVLKRIETGLAIMAPPITYAIGGEQYIVVPAGMGGAMKVGYFPGYAALEYANRERLFAFRLDGKPVPLPDRVAPAPVYPLPDGLPTDPDTLAAGEKLYTRHCARCHAARGAKSGYPDLWNLSPAVDDAFDAIVLEGALGQAGMARFADVLDARDTLAIRAWLAADARALRAHLSTPAR